MAKTLRAAQPDDFYLLRTTADPQLSPDLNHVAWVLVTQDREVDCPQTKIQLGSVGGGDARDFTVGPRDSSPRWSPDGSQLAFLRAGEGAPPQLHLAPLSGGEPRAITNLPGGVSELAWSPDGQRIAFTSRVGVAKPVAERSPQERNAPRVLTRLNGRLDGRGWLEGRAHVFVLDLASGKPKQITDGDWDDLQPAWSPDGSTIVFVSDRKRSRHIGLFRTDVYAVPAAGGRARKLVTTGGAATFPTFSPDGTLIAYTGDTAGDGFWNEQSGLFVADAGGAAEPRQIAVDLDREIGSSLPVMAAAAWRPDSRTLLILAADRGRNHVFLADVGGAKTKLVVGDDRVVDGYSLGRDGKTIAYSSSWFDAPHEVYVTGVAAKSAPVAISNANEAVRTTIRLPKPKRVSHTTPDGLEIEAFLCLPEGSAKNLPLLMDVHGGPHGSHPLPNSAITAAIMTGAGYATVFPNPRGSSSYGRDFMRASHRDWGGKDYEDLMGCVDALVKGGVANPKRLYVQGYSYGGYMSAWIIGQTDRFRAAVVGAPVVDLVSMEGTSDVPGFLTHEFTGPAWEAPALLRERSPLTHLSRASTPTLINHWEGDLRCPIGQADQLFHALLSRGVDVVQVRYPGGAHGIRMPSQVIDRFERIIDWFAQHS